MAEEDRQRARSASHVARNSHPQGGGHKAPPSPKVQVTGRAKAPGIIAKAAMNPGSWDDGGALIEQGDDMATHPLYANMKFADYVYQEYPKWVIGDGTEPHHKLAQNEDEEAAILAGHAVLTQDELKAQLISEAEGLGLMIDRRWGPEKLQKVIRDARTK